MKYIKGMYIEESKPKLRLIDILNKIANGELKEGAKVKYKEYEYIYKDDALLRETEDNFYFVDLLEEITLLNLTKEVELIEPKHLPDVGKMAECFSNKGNTLEPTDNTKIEELELGNTYLQDAIIQLTDKLNEVIRYINK